MTCRMRGSSSARARQIHDDIALFAIHRVQFDAEFRAVVIDLAAAVAGHAPHLHSKLEEE